MKLKVIKLLEGVVQLITLAGKAKWMGTGAWFTELNVSVADLKL